MEGVKKLQLKIESSAWWGSVTAPVKKDIVPTFLEQNFSLFVSVLTKLIETKCCSKEIFMALYVKDVIFQISHLKFSLRHQFWPFSSKFR